MNKKGKFKELTVVATAQLTENMRRVTLTGEELDDFPENSDGAYIKLRFADADNNLSIVRTYTVAQHRFDNNEIDVDFMLHSNPNAVNHGVAAPWSIKANIGDKLTISGPGRASFINLNSDWVLLAADMTALPALSANLRRLSKDSVGYVVVEILSAQDKQELNEPQGIEVIWVINHNAGSDDSPLFHQIEKLRWREGQASAWVACEFKTMKKIRQYLKKHRGLEKSHLYISSYWKQGLNEEQHKVAKRNDSN